jgi:hypothetical protein
MLNIKWIYQIHDGWGPYTREALEESQRRKISWNLGLARDVVYLFI